MAAILAVAGAAAVTLARRGATVSPSGSPLGPAASATLLGGGLAVASMPALARHARLVGDRRVLWTLLVAQQLRFGIALVHLGVLQRAYPGITDVDDYDPAGRAIAQHLRAGRVSGLGTTMRSVPWETRLPGPLGTNLMRLLTGAVYAAVGPSRERGFVVFSWLGFWGLMCFHRAFAIAVPRGRSATYLRLLLFQPSLAFHTSSIGKEAWMVASLGVGSLGVARALTGSARRGIVMAAAGGIGAGLMRAQVGGRIGVTVGSELRDAGARSAFGGSAFSPVDVRSIRDVPLAAASVLFRPHPLEAHNLQARMASMEGLLLLALSLRRIGWGLAAAAHVRRQPYVTFAAACSAVLVAYMSRVANFGMLVRQRASLLPFYLVLLSIPPRR